MNSLRPSLGKIKKGSSNAIRQSRMLAEPSAQPRPAEDIQQRIIEGQNCLSRSRFALAPAPSVELPVDAPSLVSLGKNNVEATLLGHAVVQQNVHTSTGHIGGHGDLALLSSLRDDICFIAILSRIEDDVRKSRKSKAKAQGFRCGNRTRADQNRSTFFSQRLSARRDRIELHFRGW